MLQCSYQLEKKHWVSQSDVLRKGQSRRIICQLSITTSTMAEDIFSGKHQQSLLKHCSYLRKTTVISTGKLTGKSELINWTNEKTVQLNQGKTELFNNQGMNTYKRPTSRKCKQIKWQTQHHAGKPLYSIHIQTYQEPIQIHSWNSCSKRSPCKLLHCI